MSLQHQDIEVIGVLLSRLESRKPKSRINNTLSITESFSNALIVFPPEALLSQNLALQPIEKFGTSMGDRSQLHSFSTTAPGVKSW